MKTAYVRALASQSQRLVQRLDTDPLVGSVVRGTATWQQYVEFLLRTYQYVRWSGLLLAATARGLRASGRARMLVEVVTLKAEEEAPHDRWVLDDLRNLGLPGERVIREPVPSAIQSYFFWSSTLAEAGSPGFLGAAYALEFVSMQRARQAAENLRARAEIPNVQNALSFLVSHGDADQEHIRVLEETLSSVTDPADVRDIRLSCSVLCTTYPHFFGPHPPLVTELPPRREATPKQERATGGEPC
ncbi:MAG TPA: iron-containing redox enzyme family protein [Polyangiaceae bacterium]|nr:iron-containing redox enzyme family protein [Polyangiaceae bacterium]